MTQVRDLAGKHLGKTITITTANTTDTGVLQGIQHVSDVLNAGNPMRDEWIRGRTATAITLLPDQTIVAELTDEVTIKEDA
ncbi:hypothetical protein [Arthrobacter sp. GMC3]|uniref:hypothetical protein n=1 Tax=Arthrobacter sp. GMC3 TaxID=2058894 RepID=UPI000CE4ACA4|nr:hypothetical protein [Arthrobacter sp. GMC3]